MKDGLTKEQLEWVKIKMSSLWSKIADQNAQQALTHVEALLKDAQKVRKCPTCYKPIVELQKAKEEQGLRTIIRETK